MTVLAAHGAEGITIRLVSRQAGVSPGLLHHYFPGGKTELLHAAVSAAVERGTRRMLDVLDDRTGLDAIRAVALELLPVTSSRRLEWSAWVALMGSTLTDPVLNAEQRDRLNGWRTVLQTLLEQAELPGIDAPSVALRLAGLLDGLGLHSLMDPNLLTPARLAAEVDAFLGTLQ